MLSATVAGSIPAFAIVFSSHGFHVQKTQINRKRAD